MADLTGLRQSYQSVLAEQLKKGLGQIGNVYAQRGTTGSGEEANAFGEFGNQYGQAANQNEMALRQFGEGQRQFDVNQGLAQQQFGLQSELGRGNLGLGQAQLAQQGTQFGQNLGLQQQQLAQSGQQFGQSLAEQQAARLGSQGLQQQQLTQQGSQFKQSLYGGGGTFDNQGNYIPPTGAKTIQERSLEGQNAQFEQSLAEQVKNRISQASQSQQSLYGGGGTFDAQGNYIPPTGARTLQERALTKGDASELAQANLATRMGFADPEEYQAYMADPETARRNGIYSNSDKAEIQRLLAEGPSGDKWLQDHYGLTRREALKKTSPLNNSMVNQISGQPVYNDGGIITGGTNVGGTWS